MSDDLFEDRVAENEAAFRNVNESLRAPRTLADVDKTFPFCCECGRLACSDILDLTLVEYERVRKNPRQFFVVDGHEIDAVETIVDRHERYAVVQKREEAGEIAEDTDPRS